MILTAAEGTRLLLVAGLISTADITDGGLVITQLRRRNSHIRIEKTDGTGFQIKQARNGLAASTVRNEAKFLESDLEELRSFVPRIVYHDPTLHLFVTELVGSRFPRGSPTNWKAVTKAQVEELGRAIAVTHGIRSSRRTEAFPLKPMGFSLLRPGLEFFRDLTAASIELIAAIQRDRPLCDLLLDLEVSWQSSSLIHGDLKFDNIVFQDLEDTVLLVDWEFAEMGDPRWDLGSVLADLLHNWLIDEVTSSIEKNDRAVSQLPFFNTICSFCGMFLRSYCVNASKTCTVEFAVECLGFSAARLLQTAFETSQFRTELDLYSVKAVQMAANLAVYRAALARLLLETEG